MVAFEDEPNVPEHRRVRLDEESGLHEKSTNNDGDFFEITRTMSQSSMRSRVRSPALSIPIEYRTMSFNIADTERQLNTKTAKEEAAAELGDLDWHQITPDEVYKRLLTSTLDGLSKQDVDRRLKEYGRNTPSAPESRLFQQIFWYFFGGFGSVLFIASILVFISWKPLGNPPAPANLGLAIVLALVFVIQAVFSAYQDFSTSKVMNSITGMLPDSCLVVRDGIQTNVMAPDLVPGDVVFIKAGDKLPADVRFVEVSDSKFDRSVLTGESIPITATVDSTDNNYLETRCIGMQGTHCVSGNAVGIVVSTGDQTVFGRIAKLTTAHTGRSPLQKEVLKFVIIIVSLMLLMNIVNLTVWGAYTRKAHPDWLTTPLLIIAVVSVAVAFVPEGLPIALTASLTIVANIMKKQKILCKSLKTVETLGAISVLLSDKTGTLTQNLMTVSQYAIEDKVDVDGPAIRQLRVLSAICNAAEFEPTSLHLPLKDRQMIGDATDTAVLRFSEGLGPVSEMRAMWKKQFNLAFNSKNKFMIRVFTPHSSGKDWLLSKAEVQTPHDMILTIKGAPDILMARCSKYVDSHGEVQVLSEQKRASIDSVKDAWSRQGKRVITLAKKILPGEIQLDPSSVTFEKEMTNVQDLTLVGMVAIVDPPRPEIPEVINTMRKAGVRTMMVTGDFKLTAQSIARECNIITSPDGSVHDFSNLKRSSKNSPPDSPTLIPSTSKSLVISGPELITLNEHQWSQLCSYPEVVFARTTPEQKLRIVKEYQSRDNLVGMTGDGVNDAPSLKQADIGIAPGTGSDIAIEAADMVLLDSFSAIVVAVTYGRIVYDNLKKTICYLLPAGSYSEFWPIATNIWFGLPQILSSFLMIIICCFTDCAAAIALAYEKPEADVMLRPPRNPKKDRLVDWKLLFHAYVLTGTLETVCSFSMAYWYLQRNGVPFSLLWFGYGDYQDYDQDYVTAKLNTASSIYFVNLVVMQWFNLMCVRTRRMSIFSHPPLLNKATMNWTLFPAILFALVCCFVFLYPEGLQRNLGTAPVPVEHWFLPMGFGLGLLSLDEARKAAIRRWPDGMLAKIAW